MKEYNRREFLKYTAAGGLVTLAGCGKYEGLEETMEEASGYVNAVEADMVVKNATIYTVDATRLWNDPQKLYHCGLEGIR